MEVSPSTPHTIAGYAAAVIKAPNPHQLCPLVVTFSAARTHCLGQSEGPRTFSIRPSRSVRKTSVQARQNIVFSRFSWRKIGRGNPLGQAPLWPIIARNANDRVVSCEIAVPVASRALWEKLLSAPPDARENEWGAMAEGAVCFSASAPPDGGEQTGGAVRGRVDGPLTHLERPSEHLGERREDPAGKREPNDARLRRRLVLDYNFKLQLCGFFVFFLLHQYRN